MQCFMLKFPDVIKIWVSQVVFIKPLKGAHKTGRHWHTDKEMHPRDRPWPKKAVFPTKIKKVKLQTQGAKQPQVL